MLRHFSYLVLVFGFLLSVIRAEIVLEQDFDNGALLLEASYVDGDTVFLAGPDNYNAGRWKWIYFRAEGVQDRDLRFRIGDNYATGSSRLSNLRMVYREEGSEWAFFDNNILDTDSGHFTFYNDAPFSSDTVRVAFSFPYPVERVTAHIESLQHSPWVFSTPSSDEDFIIGLSPGGIDDRGRTIGPLPLYGFMITDPAADGEKERIVFCSGVHANEVLAGYVLEGLIEWLVSDDPRAAALRREVEFFVYPMVNPDGRYAGYNRGNIQWPDRDTNRFWREDLYEDMGDIRQIAEAMKEDTGSEGVTWFFDFHSWSNTLNHFVIMNPPAQETVFWRELKRLEPDMGESVGDTSLWMSRRFATERLNAEYGLIPETMFRPGEYPERYLRMGENFGIALFHEVNPPGFKDPEANTLVLVREGDEREADVRRFGAWLENVRPGALGIDYSADMRVDVLDSAGSLDADQVALLEQYDLVIVPPYGTGPAADFASTAWNQVKTPILNMNAGVAASGNWNWFDVAGALDGYSRDLTVRELVHPVFENIDTANGSVRMYESSDTPGPIISTDESTGNGRVVGWTDHETDGVNHRHPWLVVWSAHGDPFYEGGSDTPAGTRTFFSGTDHSFPDAYTEDGRRLLVNTVFYTLRTRILMLVAPGHSAEADVRAKGGWLLEQRPGEYAIDFSADVQPDVLDSPEFLSADQREVLDRYDLILMPRFGVGSAGNFGTRDWNDVGAPILCMNPFIMADTRWGWLPPDTPSPNSPGIRDTVVVRADSPLFQGVDIVDGRVSVFRNSMNVKQVEIESSDLTGETLGWTDREADGANLRFPWIMKWSGGEDAYPPAGEAAPGGRRMLFLGPIDNAPGNFSESGLRILLNAIEHMSRPPLRSSGLDGFQGWRHHHFTPAELADLNISGPMGSAAGDDTLNLVNYTLGLTPRDSSRYLLSRASVGVFSDDDDDEESFLTLTLRRRTDVHDVSVRVEVSRDLLQWADEAVRVQETPVDENLTEFIYRAPGSTDEHPKSFLRVRFEPDW